MQYVPVQGLNSYGFLWLNAVYEIYLKCCSFRDGPLLVVACGRDTISIASSIKRLASQNVFVVQVCLCHLLLILFCT